MAKLKVKEASCWPSGEAGRIAFRGGSQVCEDFRAAMAAAGITSNGQIVADGKLRRFKAEGDHARNSWYVLHSGPPAAGAFGCWKRGFKERWCERNGSLSQAEWQDVRERWQTANQERERVETQRRKKARKTAAWIYERANPVQSHAYLEAKRVQPFGELRESYRSELLLPLRDINGELHSLQFIAPDERYEGERNKNFLGGGRVSGCFYTLADKAEGPLIICEGYATGASIHQATDHAVICAMNSGNLLEVAKAARELWPNREIIVAADNDQFTDGNPGLTKATAAAKAIRAKLAVPEFKDLASKPTDFNDLATAEGLEGVKEHVGSAQVPRGNDNENSTRTGDVTDDETIAQLAALPLLEYERHRKDEAERLGCRESVLDKLVEAKRPKNCENNGLQGTAVKLEDVEPWPNPVNGAEILDEIAKRFLRYLVLPQGAADVTALWSAHTHIYDAFQISPRLIICSPTQECGKTTLCDCTSLFCQRAVRTDNMTEAVMFRLVSGHRPTILADECDKWAFKNEELVGLFNSGNRKGGRVMRCEGDSNELRRFNAYAPVALASIGGFPSQLHSRAIVIRLERATRKEIKMCARFELDHVELEHELNRKLARWIADNRDRIESCKPKLPENLFNRIADNWRPLFQIAEVAGGDWPKRCATALVKLTTREDDTESLRVELLADTRQVFTADRMFSKDLTEALAAMKERPWSEICRGKPITERWLARNLAAFGIHPKSMRIGEGNAKGYERSDFDEAFARYLPDTPIPSVTPSHTRENGQISSVTRGEVVTDMKNEPSSRKKGICDGVTDKKGDAPENADFGKRDIEAERGRSAGKEKLRL